ncbi:pimeloyl-[acyl-carrier protein] methyl ester esterase [Thalassotalea insulae]|uniref:Pimeloyl-[acyl-carrier protein] methyl ester esterase n=1 Tax=Thalassotalea insulae TaxID=2056778 RepID=A0ABQ6GS19_9GAMM|nr:pimeloyl-ACP methyl ester esterase BioH [Thalassotalea insulae]GLX78718.1 pimeloyl-[acyl-carrier protein] methyl ester esterase [Thalassotalea insulae]
MAEMLKIASIGAGTPIVLIHGWGLNSGVWQPMVEQLQHQFKMITIDIPGYGENLDIELSPYTIEHIAQHMVETVAEPAIYLGWSLGGLVASQIAFQFPEMVKGLVTVASTPYFVKQQNWPGIEANVLQLFHRQLNQDIKKTIDNFLKIQAMGSPHVRQDIKLIRDLVMQYPMPSAYTLDLSLSFLEQVDQRQILAEISVPLLRIYGKLDGLVPKAVIPLVDKLVPNSEKVIIERASHAPFISELKVFTESITQWINECC